MKNPLDSLLTRPDHTPMNATDQFTSPSRKPAPACACCGLPVSLDGTSSGFTTDVPQLTFCDAQCAKEWERRKGKRLFRVVLMAACI